MGAVRNDEGFESMTTMALDASAEAVTEDTDRAPSLCEPYTDLGLVARGGMGAVRRALDLSLIHI